VRRTEIFLDFALETGAIGTSEKQAFAERNEKALDQLAAFQAKFQSSDPTLRFVALLKAALGYHWRRTRFASMDGRRARTISRFCGFSERRFNSWTSL